MKIIIIVFGFIMGIILLFSVITSIANVLFHQKTNKEIDRFIMGQQASISEPIQFTDIEHLPSPVKKWLITAGLLESDRVHTVRSKQSALVRLDQKSENWMELEAEQYFTIFDPGFIWKANFRVAPFLHIVGRDMYANGEGSMLIKFQSLFTIADAKGYEIDQGSLVRYLAEMVWAPSAALEDYIIWEEIDENSAKATMEYKEISASGVFTFDDEGNVIHFIADRYGDFDGKYIKIPWSVQMSDHQFLDQLKVPTKAEITWKLDAGDYTWYILQVQELDYNEAVRYKQ